MLRRISVGTTLLHSQQHKKSTQAALLAFCLHFHMHCAFSVSLVLSCMLQVPHRSHLWRSQACSLRAHWAEQAQLHRKAGAP